MTGMTAIVINFNWFLLGVLVLWTLVFAPPLYIMAWVLWNWYRMECDGLKAWKALPDDEIEERIK